MKMRGEESMNQQILEKYAKLIADVGVNVKEDDGVLLSVSSELLPLARLVAKECWKKGAKNVVLRLADLEMDKMMYENAKNTVFDSYPAFEVQYMEEMLKQNYARVSISAPNPTFFENIDKDRQKRRNGSIIKANKVLRKYMDSGKIKWTVVVVPCEAWAKAVYPELDAKEGLRRLWEDVIKVIRLDKENPSEEWQKHDELLKKRQDWLNSQNFAYMHYQAEGTDLMVGLAEKHSWLGGSSKTPDGVKYMANMPTEEIFSAPHSHKVDGTLRATKPLCLMGNIIEGMEFTFKDGKVETFSATKNGELLENMMNMDEGAKRLGEIALVPHSSPISQVGRLFMSTLFDENASCHFALGESYAETIIDGENMQSEERQKLGANSSMIHIDFMVGSDKLSITGIKANGEKVKVMENGEFVGI